MVCYGTVARLIADPFALNSATQKAPFGQVRILNLREEHSQRYARAFGERVS